jgi:hypothetical protein
MIKYYLYVLSNSSIHGDEEYSKIGVSVNPTRRMSSIAASSKSNYPFFLYSQYEFSTRKDAEEIESKIVREFKPLKGRERLIAPALIVDIRVKQIIQSLRGIR